MLPNFLLIGAPKAGTSALAAYLEAHPEVFMAPEKEIHFFDEHYARGLDWYESRFAGVRGERAVGEATPTYMYLDDALSRMTEHLPEVRLLVLLRNPVDRAYSHYWWTRVTLERRSFEEAARSEMAGVEAPYGFNYVAGGRYLERIERVREFYPRAPLLVVLLEELRARPPEVYAEICRFLGVRDDVAPPVLGSVVNAAYRVRWPRLRETMYRLKAWKRLPLDWAERIDRWNRVPFRYPPMAPDLRAELEAYYAAPNAALAEWLGRPLTAWERAAPQRDR